MDPTFSVIIPLYNREKIISIAIKSVLTQTFGDFELIIVDDCSTDGSLKIIESIDDSRIKIIKHQINLGAAASRNTGIKISRGKYISLLDSDDYFHQDFLLKTYETLKETDSKVGFMWTGYILKIKNKDIENVWKPDFLNSTYETFLKGLKVGTNAGITIKKEVFNTCSYFNDNLKAAEDTEFFLRISKMYNYVYCENKLITILRDGDDRLSKNFKKIAESYNEFIPSHFDYIDKNRQLQKKYYYKLMWLNYHIPQKKTSRFYFFKLLKNNNINFKIFTVFFLYEFFPTKFAIYIHQKISKN